MDIDVTILIQLALFVVVLVTLNGILLKPFMRVVERRREKIQGALDEAERLGALGAEHMQAYQERIREAHKEAQAERDRLRAAGYDEKRRTLDEARAQIASFFNRTRSELSRAELEAHARLAADTEALARRLVAKVLGREVRP